MSQTIQFPQGPIVDPQTGYVSLEWFEWFQNPQILSLVIGTALDPASGGTGIISYTVGDIIYASAATTLSKLADVATGNALISGGVGVAPSWGKIGLTTHVSGTLPIANGGTNSATALSGQSIMVSDGTKIVQGGAGTTTTVLHGNAAGAPSYGAVSISADVSGLGTNVATFLGTPSSANLAAALTDETGTGSAVFSDSPAFTTQISTPSIVTASGALGITPAAGSGLNVNLSTTGDLNVNSGQLYVDTSTGYVGAGNTVPNAQLDVSTLSTSATRGIFIGEFGSAAATLTGLRSSAGSINGQSAPTAGQNIFNIGGAASDGTNFTDQIARISFVAAETITSTAHGSFIDFNTVQIGTTTLSVKWRMQDFGGLTALGNYRFSHGTSALATTATEGFIFIQSCSGPPTGVPASAPTGQIAMVYDSSNNHIYFYNGAWRSVAVT